MYISALTPNEMEPRFDKEIRVRLKRFWDDELTNEEVAEATGIHKNTVSKYKNGASINQISNLWKLCKFLEERLGKEITLEDALEIVNVQRLSDDTD